MGCRSLLLAKEIVFLALVRITSCWLVIWRISTWGGCHVLLFLAMALSAVIGRTFFDFLSWCVFLCHASMNYLSAARLPAACGLRFWLHTTVACTCETLHQNARGLSRRSCAILRCPALQFALFRRSTWRTLARCSVCSDTVLKLRTLIHLSGVCFTVHFFFFFHWAAVDLQANMSSSNQNTCVVFLKSAEGFSLTWICG